MANTAEQEIELIVDELNAAEIPLTEERVRMYWERHSAAVTTGIRVLRTKRDSLTWLMGQVRKLIDVEVGVKKVKNSQLLSNLQKLYDNTLAELTVELEYSSVTSGGSITPTSTLVGETYCNSYGYGRKGDDWF